MDHRHRGTSWIRGSYIPQFSFLLPSLYIENNARLRHGRLLVLERGSFLSSLSFVLYDIQWRLMLLPCTRFRWRHALSLSIVDESLLCNSSLVIDYDMYKLPQGMERAWPDKIGPWPLSASSGFSTSGVRLERLVALSQCLGRALDLNCGSCCRDWIVFFTPRDWT